MNGSCKFEHTLAVHEALIVRQKLTTSRSYHVTALPRKPMSEVAWHYIEP